MVSTVISTATTTIASSANPPVLGQAVTFTATVSPVSDGGMVAFTNGTAALSGCETVPLGSTGTATC